MKCHDNKSCVFYVDVIELLVENIFNMELDDKFNIAFCSNFTLDRPIDRAKSFIIDVELHKSIFKEKSDQEILPIIISRKLIPLEIEELNWMLNEYKD